MKRAFTYVGAQHKYVRTYVRTYAAFGVQAQRRASEARIQALKEAVVLRREVELRKREAIIEKTNAKWLQTEYPLLLASRLLDARSAMAPAESDKFTKMTREAVRSGFFKRQVIIGNLWQIDDSFTIILVHIKPPGGGHQRVVRCTPAFEGVLRRYWSPAIGGPPAPDAMLLKLLEACVPLARDIFLNMYSPLRLLHMNDYVMEKAFAYGVIALSKWLGPDRFPNGVYGEWPPTPPPQPSLALVVVEAEGDLSPRRRVGLPAASSGMS
jgi:hypothetical protein